MVVLQNIVLKNLTLIAFLHFPKNRLLLKYFVNHNFFSLSDLVKHLEKPLILQINLGVKPTLCDNNDDNLKIIFSLQFSQYFLT